MYRLTQFLEEKPWKLIVKNLSHSKMAVNILGCFEFNLNLFEYFFLFQVCTNCYKDTKTKHHGFLKADHPPPKKRRVNSHGPFSLPRDPAEYFDPAGNPAGTHPEGSLGSNPTQEEEKVAPADVTCPLCRRKFCKFSFKVLHCQPHAGSSYFPFLSELPMPEDYGEFFLDCQRFF